MIGIILAGLGIAGLIAVVTVISKFSEAAKDISALAKVIGQTDFDQIEMEYETTPKSVSGMTSLCIPRIAVDFPDFNWHEFKQKSENMLISAFRAISEEDASIVVNASSDLRSQIGLIIDGNHDGGIHEIYKDIKIHQTEIKDYRKQGGNCIITLQSSVGYIHYKTKAGGIIEGSDSHTCQTRYNIELLYVQDVTKIAYGQTAMGSNCPNCGAPIASLGNKVCSYCGCGLTDVNVRVWSINRYTEA